MDRNTFPFLCHTSPLSLSNLFLAFLKLLLLLTLTQASPATRVHCFSVIALDVYPAPCLARWQAPEGLLLISSARSRLADWIEMLPRLSGHADVSGENSLEPRDQYLMLQLNLLAWSLFHPLLWCEDERCKHQALPEACNDNSSRRCKGECCTIRFSLPLFRVSNGLMSISLRLSSLLVGSVFEIKKADISGEFHTTIVHIFVTLGSKYSQN